MRVALFCLVIFTLSVGLFHPTLSAPFCVIDDGDYVTQNRRVQQGLSLANLHWAFTTDHAGNYHPLTWLTLMADTTLFGPEPRGYRRTNVLLHALNAVLVLLTLMTYAGSLNRSAAAALIWAVHPLRVESVAWISERKDVLAAFFGLSALLFHHRWTTGGRPIWYALLVAAFVASLLSKPMLVTLPLLLILLDYWPLGRRAIGEKLPLLGISAVMAAVTLQVQRSAGAVVMIQSHGLLERLATSASNYLDYMIRMADCRSLLLLYPLPDATDWLRGIFAGGALALISGLLWSLRHRNPASLVGWLWFGGLLVPVIGLVQVGMQSTADRYTYLPMIGLLMAVIWSLPRISPIAGITGLLMLAGSFSWCTQRQIGYWQSNRTLMTRSVELTSDNFHAMGNLAVALDAEGETPQAVDWLNRALEIRPTYAMGHHNLAVMLLKLKKNNAAIDHFLKAIEYHPTRPEYHGDLGLALFQLNRVADAISPLRQSADMNPEDAAVNAALAKALNMTDQTESALPYFSQALALAPGDPSIHYHYGLAFQKLGRWAQAAEQYRRTLELDPVDAAAHNQMGMILAKLNQMPMALESFKRAVQLAPREPMYQANLDRISELLRNQGIRP